MTQKNSSGKRLITFWIVTGLLLTGMLAGGLSQLLGAEWTAAGFRDLGYPMYFMHLLGAWKMLGVVVLLVPGYPRLKEWAYAGFFFLMTGAVVSQLAIGAGLQGIVFQSIYVLLIVASWWLRPASRRFEFKQAPTPQWQL
ncbi:DoxX family protein [Longitalea luteola]|uniref:DoxX family protein n=1 Tax=Longitalea luteola TaxID=2812563 RepID=UPI001A961E7E|nr:DoxX family protein [Longitalea luteola]